MSLGAGGPNDSGGGAGAGGRFDPSVEEMELGFRKVARGDTPKVGDVLLRGQEGWIFSSAIIDVGALQWDGATGGPVVPIGNAGFVRFMGSNGLPPPPPGASAQIYTEVVELGAGSVITEDLPNGELIFNAGGLATVSGVVTYENMVQSALVRIGITRGGIDIAIGSAIADISGVNTFFVASVQVTAVFKPQDRLWMEFGRLNLANFTADIINADLLAYVVSLDSRP